MHHGIIYNMLNSQQQKAVQSVHGKILVLAGAGSGKTSVLVQRCVYLIQELKISPATILGLTFTNKAAEEMRTRVEKQIDAKQAKDIFLATFHSFCFFVLKQEIHNLGYTNNFSLYDQKDILRLKKSIMAQLQKEQESTTGIMIQEEKIQEEMKRAMKAYNAVDFDGLLQLTLTLFKECPLILEKYQNQFLYIMVDEYQDANAEQVQIVAQLAKQHGNLFVVGDDDQLIYSWRGAQTKHMISFTPDTLIKLEQNYRSTQPILNTANKIIQYNHDRYTKNLWSTIKQGDKVRIFCANEEEEEARCIIHRILVLKEIKGLAWKDFAILYRSNRLSKSFEIALMNALYQEKSKTIRGIPYRVLHGIAFYERAEIKDLISYLKTVMNPEDQMALLRIINYPKRGISIKTIELLVAASQKQGKSIWQILQKETFPSNISTLAKKNLQNFAKFMREAQEMFASRSLKEALTWLVHTLQWKKTLEEEAKSPQIALYKWENIQHIIALTDIQEPISLHNFLNSLLLEQTIQNKKKEPLHDRVNLLTLHSAKGLEFTACFLVGLEDNILPHARSTLDNKCLEEERRLFYVGITRATKYLVLSMSKNRIIYGKRRPTIPSRFLFELPKNSLEAESPDYPRPFFY